MNRHRQPTLLMAALIGLALLADPVGPECLSCCPGEGASTPVVSSFGCCGNDCAWLVSGEKQPALAHSERTTTAASYVALLALPSVPRHAIRLSAVLPLALARSAPAAPHSQPLRI